jgi:hypothetical protein
MKKVLINYVLFVLVNYINEDLSMLTKFGKLVIYPAHIVRVILAVIFSIVCFPIVALHMWYKNSLEEKAQILINHISIILNS